ncbi:hypothetical protein CO058_02745 [candidate division WWE3 bacterium CG_4_9_14_0_2_um_filter_35_11]|uniref:Orn/DAP/Arg decarboxylase 2 N-terminal domain-containing protein n=1 Tax=candidate division WWE3 bacterium CG_4_9_14_0_2_um_filter_35_11 TaxID=1975077 RepID=A0A2M8ELH6_UNCKA|nr:MAG: hypothetical protein CO058_02745 [candidate division WWE3 bacterium CG_4_9_14_0_2_um_filter_35_11]
MKDNYSAPYTLYDLNRLSKNYIEIKKLFKSDQIFYAVKSNKLFPVLKTLNSEKCSFEVNTEPELDAVLKTGGNVKNIVNSAPVKTSQCISYMYSRGVNRFAFDSYDEVNKISENASGTNLFLRVYTSNEGSGQALNTKYGANISDAVDLIDYAISLGFNVFGITFSVGSQCENIPNWNSALKLISPLFKKYSSLNTIDIGGGFPIEYVGGSLSISEIANTINTALQKYYDKRPSLFLEPGRYLSGSIGKTVSSVIGLRENKEVKWCIIDVSIFGGFLELFEFGEDFSYKVTTDSKSKEKFVYNIAGPTCDGCDILLRDITLPKLKRGDHLTFYNTGAYTNEYASDFNGFPRPKTIFMKDGKVLS